MEIEAKYAILGPLNPAVLTTLDLSPYAVHPDGEQHHQDVVLDTPAHSITSSGQALRLRQCEGQVTLTYKGPNTGADGVHEREEVEATLSAPVSYNPRTWPREVADRIVPQVGKAELAPLVKMYIHRRRWVVQREGQTIGEMALDQGIISAGGRTARVHELEVELKAEGLRADLEALQQRLLEELPLQPQPRGKLQRGLALLQRHRTLDGHTPIEAVGRHMIRRQVRRLRASEPVARAGKDPEGVHEMRVAARRLRTTLHLLEEIPLFSRKRLRALRRGLRGLARRLGVVRDLDILLQRVERYARTHPEQRADLKELRARLLKQRRVAREQLLACMDRPKVQQVLRRIEAFASESPAPSNGHPVLLVRHFAGSALWLRYESLLSFESVVRDAPPPVLHELRIACKRLRYALELFEKELGKGAQPLLKALVKVQDHLGALQDTSVALDLVASVQQARPQNTGLGRYAAALSGERDQLRTTFEPVWNDLSDAGFCQELAELIAGL